MLRGVFGVYHTGTIEDLEDKWVGISKPLRQVSNVLGEYRYIGCLALCLIDDNGPFSWDNNHRGVRECDI